MNSEQLVMQAKSYVKDLFKNNAGGHDADHTLRVYHNAMLISENEPSCDPLVVSLAALLHDVDDYKIFSTENNENARVFLSENQVPEGTTETVCKVINAVSFSANRGKRPESIEEKIVQDADRLDAIGAIGIARTFAFGGEHGRPLMDSVEHFYNKLLLLKDMMNTETAVRIAEKRHSFIELYLKQLNDEMNGNDIQRP